MSELTASLVLRAKDAMSGPLRAARASLERVQAQARKVEDFRRLRTQTEQTGRAWQESQRRAAALGAEMRRTARPSAKLKAAFAAATQQAARHKAASLRQQGALRTLRRELLSAGIDTKKLSQHKKRLANQTDQLGRKIRRLERVGAVYDTLRRKAAALARGTARGVSKIGSAGVAATKVAGAAAATATFAFKRLFIDTASTYERYRVQLAQLTGSQEGARKAMSWVQDFAVNTPLQVEGVMSAFTRLKAFGIDPMNGSLQSVVDQVSKLGGGQAEVEGVVLALGQAWTKQKLQGEEALQLIERGVPVWDLLSDATGRSTKELQKMSEQGRLGRKEIQLLIDEMGKQSAGAAKAQQNTWTGMVSNIQDNWSRFVMMVMDSGAFDALKNKLQLVLDKLDEMNKNGELQRTAESFGRAVLAILNAIETAAKYAMEVIGWLKDRVDDVINLVDNLTSRVDKVFGTSANSTFGGVADTSDAHARLAARIAEKKAAREAGLANRAPATGSGTQSGDADTVPNWRHTSALVGGVLKIEVQGDAKVREVRSDNPNVPIDVYSGPALLGASG